MFDKLCMRRDIVQMTTIELISNSSILVSFDDFLRAKTSWNTHHTTTGMLATAAHE